jgi:hypothetical protein
MLKYLKMPQTYHILAVKRTSDQSCRYDRVRDTRRAKRATITHCQAFGYRWLPISQVIPHAQHRYRSNYEAALSFQDALWASRYHNELYSNHSRNYSSPPRGC